MRFRGLTWDHPRGRMALEAANGPITWDAQPLEGFESASIAENCAAYDLVVLDHPHLGEALNAGCLRPLDDVFSGDDIAEIRARTIGPCLESYEMAGHVWALPLDAATQVTALRPDLVADIPETWQELLDLARAGERVGLCLAGPHAFLSFLSIAQAIRPGMDLRDGTEWPPEDVTGKALTILAELAAGTPKTTHGLNPIGILEHMSARDELSLCPLIYGYVNYANLNRARPIAFHNAPRMADGPPGTILGGTGIAISTRCEMTDDLRDHLLWLMSADVQAGFIPRNAGQPSSRAAWLHTDVNAAVGNFYGNTTESLEAAAIRPRHNGYIAFQSAASELLRNGFENGTPETRLTHELADLFERSQQGAMEEAGT